jgi:hypothetical protein
MSNNKFNVGNRVNVKTTLWRQGKAVGEGAPAFGEIVAILPLQNGYPHAVVAVVGGGTFTPWEQRGALSTCYTVVPCVEWALSVVDLAPRTTCADGDRVPDMAPDLAGLRKVVGL